LYQIPYRHFEMPDQEISILVNSLPQVLILTPEVSQLKPLTILDLKEN